MIASVVACGEVGRDFASLVDFLLQLTMDAAISRGWSRVLIQRRGARRSDGSGGGGSGALILQGTLSPILLFSLSLKECMNFTLDQDV
jgi:hypothetical protein